MSGAGDLAPLIGAGLAGNSDVGFRQGVVTAWDAAAGTNAVEIGGVTVRNLPVLNLGDFTILQPGDVVGLLRFTQTYFILGRVIPPSAPDVNRATTDYDSGYDGTTGWALSTSMATKATVTFTPPSWAGEASLFVGIMAQAVNSTPNLDFMQIQPFVNGDNLPGITSVASGNNGSAFSTAVAATTITPNGPITVDGRALSVNAAWAASGSNGMNLSVQVLYRRTS